MTTTQNTIGLGGAERISSRVLKPPGGGSSNIFGPADDEPAPARVNNRGASNLVLGDEQAPSAPAPAPAAEPAADPVAEEEEEEQQNGEERGAGEPDPVSAGDGDAPQPSAPPPAAEPQKPRRQPPGGYSTPLW